MVWVVIILENNGINELLEFDEQVTDNNIPKYT